MNDITLNTIRKTYGDTIMVVSGAHLEGVDHISRGDVSIVTAEWEGIRNTVSWDTNGNKEDKTISLSNILEGLTDKDVTIMMSDEPTITILIGYHNKGE